MRYNRRPQIISHTSTKVNVLILQHARLDGWLRWPFIGHDIVPLWVRTNSKGQFTMNLQIGMILYVLNSTTRDVRSATQHSKILRGIPLYSRGLKGETATRY